MALTPRLRSMLMGSRDPHTYAAPFALDLRAASDLLISVAAQEGDTSLALPISIPIDAEGVVLLQPQGPIDAPRVPATLYVTRPTDDLYGLRIERVDGGTLVIPGLLSAESITGLSFTIGRRGMSIDAWANDGHPVLIQFGEDTSRALANALFITLNMKITKAQDR